MSGRILLHPVRQSARSIGQRTWWSVAAAGVYHPADFNDRLVLGLKGTMSEAELHRSDPDSLQACGTRRRS
jgi:hypothetical protein